MSLKQLNNYWCKHLANAFTVSVLVFCATEQLSYEHTAQTLTPFTSHIPDMDSITSKVKVLPKAVGFFLWAPWTSVPHFMKLHLRLVEGPLLFCFSTIY